MSVATFLPGRLLLESLLSAGVSEQCLPLRLGQCTAYLSKQNGSVGSPLICAVKSLENVKILLLTKQFIGVAKAFALCQMLHGA